MNLTENRTRWYILVQILLCIGLAFVAYGLVFNRSRVLGLEDQKNVDSTKTALVGTAQALLGPFPTATVPTSTATDTATATPLISATPTITPSITPSPSHAPTRFIASGTPKDAGSSGNQKSTPRATYTKPPTQPPPPIDPPTQPPTQQPPDPTQPPVTEPPVTQPPEVVP